MGFATTCRLACGGVLLISACASSSPAVAGAAGEGPSEPTEGRILAGGSTPWYPYSAQAWAADVTGAGALCKDGQMQSPVDLPECKVAKSRAAIELTWGQHNVSLKNNGHTVQLDIVGTSGKMKAGSSEYTLLQCHFHWGSEHTVDGKQMDLAAHCVHEQTAGGSGSGQRYGVMGFLYEASETESDPFLAVIEDFLPTAAASPSSFTGPLDFSKMPGNSTISNYYTYDGSLTTPPCSEVVDWYVSMQRRKISKAQLSKFQNAIGIAVGNYRPPQPLKGRTIEGCEKEAAPWYPYTAQAWAADVKGAGELCKDGQMQSPVDLPECKVAKSRAPIELTWGQHNVALKNNGHTVQLDIVGTSGKMKAGSSEYTMLQCHFHWGSEHTVDGKQMDMAVHCVHQQTTGGSGSGQRYGVMGFLYEASETESDPFLALIEDQLPTAATTAVSTFAGPLDFSKMPGNSTITTYYTYDGSLTTPPCSEVVDWYVSMQKRKISKAQLSKFQKAIGIAVGNYRPPQPLKGRTIEGCEKEAAPWYPYTAQAWAADVKGAGELCKDGQMQSPVDLPECPLPESRAPVVLTWGQHNVALKNNGHTVQLDIVGTPGQMIFGRYQYRLLQCHFHWGSEHTVGGKQMDMAVHCVHEQTAGNTGSGPRYGVMGFLYEASETESDPFLALIEDQLPTAATTAVSTFAGPLDFSKMPSNSTITNYYTYEGSLTTPPCSEVVDWYVAMARRKISKTQLQKFKNAMGAAVGNFRPPQELHGRIIEGCRTENVDSAGRTQPAISAVLSAAAAAVLFVQ